MTQDEIEKEKQRAADLARAVGGALAVILAINTRGVSVAWDPKAGRFIVDGRYVTIDTIRKELRRFETQVGIRMSKLATQLQNGTVDLEQWRTGMLNLIGSSHVVMAALAAGSIAAAAVRKDVQDRIVSERVYARKFAKDIPAKNLKTSTIKARAQSYLLAAAVTYSVVEQKVRETIGYTEAYRTTNAAESCGDCLESADYWMPIEDMPPIGSLTCGSRCRCEITYR